MKQMKNTLILLLAILSFSCTPEIDSNSIEISQPKVVERFKLVDAPAAFDGRVEFVGRTAAMKPINQERSSLNGRSIQDTDDYYWLYVASVSSPTVNGQLLSATHFSFADDKAYVSYHKQGNTHLGAVEVIDLSNPNSPSLIGRLEFEGADINAITSDFETEGAARKLWLAASDEKNGAVVIDITTNNGLLTEEILRKTISNYIDNDQVSSSANAIAATDNYVAVTCGKTHGGTFILNKNDLSLAHKAEYSNAKYIGLNGVNDNARYVTLVTGDNAKLKTQSINQFNAATNYSIGSITHQNVEAAYGGKNTLHFSPKNNNLVYVAMGENGLRTFDITNGRKVNESKGNMLIAGNTNGVSIDNDYVYIANGADGLMITTHPSTGEDITPFFYWDQEEMPASANYVEGDGDWVFVAKGEGGFKILRKLPRDGYIPITPYDPQGVPDGLEPDLEICEELESNIYTLALPERANAMENHPEFFNHPMKDIHIKEDGEVFLTFIDEGAGYRNVLGYYTYKEDNPPSSVEDLNEVIIFPNASKIRSGGGLEPGNTMKLLGTFEKGDVIGFFLIANGWVNGKVTDGRFTQYTDISFNGSGQQQSVIFQDNACSSLIIAFEDISLPSGDKDFNDAIFQITASPQSVIDNSEYVQLGN